MKNIVLVVIISLLVACGGGKNASDLDRTITEFEEFVENYADSIRKAITGDTSEPETLEELETLLGYWAEQLTEINKQQLTPEQEERVDVVTNKLFMIVLNMDR